MDCFRNVVPKIQALKEKICFHRHVECFFLPYLIVKKWTVKTWLFLAVKTFCFEFVYFFTLNKLCILSVLIYILRFGMNNGYQSWNALDQDPKLFCYLHVHYNPVFRRALLFWSTVNTTSFNCLPYFLYFIICTAFLFHYSHNTVVIK